MKRLNFWINFCKYGLIALVAPYVGVFVATFAFEALSWWYFIGFTVLWMCLLCAWNILAMCKTVQERKKDGKEIDS